MIFHRISQTLDHTKRKKLSWSTNHTKQWTCWMSQEIRNQLDLPSHPRSQYPISRYSWKAPLFSWFLYLNSFIGQNQPRSQFCDVHVCTLFTAFELRCFRYGLQKHCKGAPENRNILRLILNLLCFQYSWASECFKFLTKIQWTPLISCLEHSLNK